MSQKKYASLSSLQNFLDNLKETFATLVHKHTVSDLTDYKVDTSLSSTSSNPVANRILNDEFEAISVAMNALELSVDGKSDSVHSHNEIYYTQEQVDEALSHRTQVQIITWGDDD